MKTNDLVESRTYCLNMKKTFESYRLGLFRTLILYSLTKVAIRHFLFDVFIFDENTFYVLKRYRNLELDNFCILEEDQHLK